MTSPVPEETARSRPLKKLQEVAREMDPPELPRWVVRMAASRWAVSFMGLLSFLDACVSPVLPDLMLVPLVLAHPKRRWYYAGVCASYSVLGAILGYYLGFMLWEVGLREIAFEYIPGFTEAVFDDIGRKYGESAFLWLFIAAFTPLPFKVFTVAAGVFHHEVSVAMLVIGSAAGRFPRFWLEAILIHAVGPALLTFYKKSKKWAWAFIITCAVVMYFLL